MFCKNCRREHADDEQCPHCKFGPPDTLSGAPTLIKGPGRPASIGPDRPGDPKGIRLIPLLFAISILAVVPWLLMDRNHPAAVEAPVTTVPIMSANPTGSDIDSDQIHLVINVPANHWIDTGVDMCGCAHLDIVATGDWMTPRGETVSARGLIGGRSVSSAATRDSLTQSARYGALVGRVGGDPYVELGASRHVDGDEFDDGGTLKIGMNALRPNASSPGQSSLTVRIDGEGTTDHAPVVCPVPR
ncbi:MAG TPA: hypothetical protein VFJ58_22185 [Armatimonadota bacterium]|nr:hypothetical protein [Armatimonadota bacterium]